MQQGKGRKFRRKKEKPEFDQQIIDLARVTRVTEGGKQLSFRVCIIIGDRKSRVGEPSHRYTVSVPSKRSGVCF